MYLMCYSSNQFSQYIELIIDTFSQWLYFFIRSVDSFLKTQKEQFKLSQSAGNKRDSSTIACENAELRNCSEAGQEKFLACRRSKELSCRSKNEHSLHGE